MIDVDFTIRNYRSIGDEPARFRLTDGFTALIGTNGSGKSSLLRMLYEIRPLLYVLCETGTTSNGDNLRRGAKLQNVWAPSLLPGERIFRADGSQEFQIDLIVRNGPEGALTINNQQVVLKLWYNDTGLTTSQVQGHCVFDWRRFELRLYG